MANFCRVDSRAQSYKTCCTLFKTHKIKQSGVFFSAHIGLTESCCDSRGVNTSWSINARSKRRVSLAPLALMHIFKRGKGTESIHSPPFHNLAEQIVRSHPIPSRPVSPSPPTGCKVTGCLRYAQEGGRVHSQAGGLWRAASAFARIRHGKPGNGV